MLRAYLGGAVFGTTEGSGPPSTVLLHGWRRSSADFVGVAAELARNDRSSVALDLPGFGATPAPPSPMGARGYAELLAPVLEELIGSGKPPLLVGHSLGGRVATCVAAQHPELVGGLVLTGVPLLRSAMPASSPSTRYRWWRTAARWHLVSPARLEAARRRYGSADYAAAQGVMRGVLVEMVAESYEAELAALRCPVALVWGDRDETAPLAIAIDAQRLVPGASLEVLEGIGHLVPTDAPAQLAASTLSLLGGVR